MIRNRLSGNPKLPELKLEGQELAGTLCGSPREHILREAALSVQKGEANWRLPEDFFQHY